MPREKSDRFIVAYNRIEKALVKKVNEASFLPFYRLIEKAKIKNSVVRKYEEDLREFGDLRNAIVHRRTGVDYIIAEPHLDVVERIEEIEQKLSHPLNVGELFGSHVHTVQSTDRLTVAFEIMRENKFSKIPMYENNMFLGLITSAVITRWMAGMSTSTKVPQDIPMLAEVYNFDKQKQPFEFIRRDLSIYEVEDYFKKAISKGIRMEALLITENGHSAEALLGIITPFDLLKIE